MLVITALAEAPLNFKVSMHTPAITYAVCTHAR